MPATFLAACDEPDDPTPDELHRRIIEALRTVDTGRTEGSVCGVITIELEAKSSLPVRSYANACPELGRGDVRGYITEYQSVDAIPGTTLPPDFFDHQPWLHPQRSRPLTFNLLEGLGSRS